VPVLKASSGLDKVSVVLPVCYLVFSWVWFFALAFNQIAVEMQTYQEDVYLAEDNGLIEELQEALTELPGSKQLIRRGLTAPEYAPDVPVLTVDLRLVELATVHEYAEVIGHIAKRHGFFVRDVEEVYQSRSNMLEVVIGDEQHEELKVRLLIAKSAWPAAGVWCLWPGAVPGVFPRIAPRAKLAIVIDDWGYDWEAAPWFLDFPRPFTGAVLPHLPMSTIHGQTLSERGKGVILHQPMEPLNKDVDPGPGAIYAGLGYPEIARCLQDNWASVPQARGMNNHMGSKATADVDTMSRVVQWLGKKGYFFLDSNTTAESVVISVSEQWALPSVKNDRFLDHEDDVETIKLRIQELVDMALTRGYAVGIGHVRPKTYQALKEMIPYIDRAGVELVTIDQILPSGGNNLHASGTD
jgi:polysaccharide deacetylase 2 family uncharacterized protein YibQ